MRLRGVELPDNRRFGLFVAAVCGLIAAWLMIAGNPSGALGFVSAALVAGLVAWRRPRLLQPLNAAWMALGLALGAIVGPIVLGILFFGLFTPLAIALRLAGRDELRLRRAPPGASYWRMRVPPGPDRATFARQY